MSTGYPPIETEALNSELLEHNINIDFEDNSPHQEGIILKMYERPHKSYFPEPPKLQVKHVKAN